MQVLNNCFMILFWKSLGVVRSPNECASFSSFSKGSRIAYNMVRINFLFFMARIPPTFLKPFCSILWLWPCMRNSRWCQMTDGVGARFPVGGGASERASKQADSCEEPARLRLALRSSHSRRTQGAVLSAPQAPAEEGGLLAVLLLFKLAWICSDPSRVQRSK